jgi:hypothetical protein
MFEIIDVWSRQTRQPVLRQHCYCPALRISHTRTLDVRACALAALRMVWASAAWMAVEMLATWCVRKLRGDARPSPYVCRSELTISFASAHDAKR